MRVSRALVKNNVNTSVAGKVNSAPHHRNLALIDFPRWTRAMAVVTQAKPKEMNTENRVSLARNGVSKFFRISAKRSILGG